MRPLRDEGAGDEVASAAARLVRAARSPLAPGAKERVRRAVERRPLRRPAPSPLWLLVFLVGTAAAATVVIGGVSRLWTRRATPPAQRDVRPRATTAPAPAQPPAITPTPPAVPATAPTPPASPARGVIPPHPTRRAHATPAPGPTAGKPADDDADAELVSTAMVALRREHAPRRALDLLALYLQRHARGALAEEALALSIDAATQLGDPRARTLAARYLEKFPAGRFADNARAVAAPAP